MTEVKLTGSGGGHGSGTRQFFFGVATPPLSRSDSRLSGIGSSGFIDESRCLFGVLELRTYPVVVGVVILQ